MTRRSISVAVLLPSVFAAVVIGLLLGAVVLEGPITVTEPKPGPSGEPSLQPHLGRWVLFVAGMPWIFGFFLMWLVLLVLGAAAEVGPFYLQGTPFQDFLWDCVYVVSPFINVFVLYVAGRSIDRRPGRSWTQR